MGCSMSRLDGEVAVQRCKDRKKFIKQAVEQRLKFALVHVAYIQSMRRVSRALKDFVKYEEHLGSIQDSFRKTCPALISVTSFKSESNPAYIINYSQTSENPSVSVVERPLQSPEICRVEAYSPVHQFGLDSIFAVKPSSMNSSFSHYSPNNQPDYISSSQTSQWDAYWNPFTSLDYYGYTTGGSLNQTAMEENEVLGRVHSIPRSEEKTKQDIGDKANLNFNAAGVDADDCIERDCEDGDQADEQTKKKHVQTSQSIEHQSTELSKSEKIGQISSKENSLKEEETPGFTVFVNKRPTIMSEVFEDIDDQFLSACNAAKEVSAILEASRSRYASSTNDLTAMKMLNPVSLFMSTTSRSSPLSKTLAKSSTSRYDEGYESNSDFAEMMSGMSSGSHQSTLDRLYTWEKKLYQEVRTGARVRLAYEKKCLLLRYQEAKGEPLSVIDKTRDSISDLNTQMKVSLHSVEVVSKRIEALRDEELEPQLLEMVRGLARMWEAMAECHRSQKLVLDEAKILLAEKSSKLSITKKCTIMSPSEVQKLAQSSANLETELRTWRSCFNSWMISQRLYVHALAGWHLCCIGADSKPSTLPFSSEQTLRVPSIFNICTQWSKILDTVHEGPVLDGLDFFSRGAGSLHSHLKENSHRHSHLKENSHRHSKSLMRLTGENAGNTLEVNHFEDALVTAEVMVDAASRVICAGMSASVSSLTNFSISSAEGYSNLVKQLEKTPCLQVLGQ